MHRITIEDLPRSETLSRKEARRIIGGATVGSTLVSKTGTTQGLVTGVEDRDQKVGQTFNIISTILKTQNESEGSVSRNTN
jgi:hypothetical protein